jgi:hypothetical protein
MVCSGFSQLRYMRFDRLTIRQKIPEIKIRDELDQHLLH